MVLSEEIKQKIIEILDSQEFMSDLYAGLDEKKREELGQFYTPADICIKMIEKFSYDTLAKKNFIDPTCGSGNLLIACLIAGADSEALYGNEYDETAVKLCRKRINRACDKLGKEHIKDWQIHQGNALQKRCLVDFSEEYSSSYDAAYIDDLKYAQSDNSWALENKQAKERADKIKLAEDMKNQEYYSLF